MKKTVFKDSSQKVFAEFGLVSFDDFFEYSEGRTINRNKKRNVTIMTFGRGDDRKVFFCKRFFKPHFKDILFAWRNFDRPVSQAEVEWNNANMLLENGIETYRPVCYGLQTKFGLERKSFFITEKLPGRPLTEFVSEKWSQLNRRQKEKIMVSLGKLVRRIHDAGISLPDLYLWHVFIMESHNSEQYDLAVIDLHRMSHNVRNQNRLLKNLGRLNHSMLDKYFDDGLRELLIQSYASDSRPGEVGNLIKLVKKYSKSISAKRKQKSY